MSRSEPEQERSRDTLLQGRNRPEQVLVPWSHDRSVSEGFESRTGPQWSQSDMEIEEPHSYVVFCTGVFYSAANPVGGLVGTTSVHLVCNKHR